MAIITKPHKDILIGSSSICDRVQSIFGSLSSIDAVGSSKIALERGLFPSASVELWQICVFRNFKHMAKP
jgi:hypothetical protein